MGDHPVLRKERARCADSDIEAGSLYLAGRDESLYLLRPLAMQSECVVRSSHTFVIDSIAGEGNCKMRALEVTHSIEVGDLRPALRHIGLLEASASEDDS